MYINLHHYIYSQNKQENTHYDRQKKEEASCGVQDKHKVDPIKQRERYEKHRQRRSSKKHSRHKRSISVEKHVEAMVVVDTNMMEYYKNEDVTNYVLTIMNMVSTIFHDATIGNAVNIVIVRIMLLEEHQDDLKITHHADKTLKSFCKWQKRLNPKDDDDPHHHDVAILLTRKNICSRLNEPCSTLGLAQVAGICQPHRSCNINEDTGLPLAFTVAHELGHNFGMRHDGVRNECDLKENEEYMYVMAAHLIATSGPIRWSECSKRSITKFIDRGWAYCLDDEPEDHEDFVYPVLPPGTMYDADHQCRLTYGGDAVLCEGTKIMDEPLLYPSECKMLKDVCSTLWCRVNNKCSTKLDAGAEGTICDQNKWCFNGNCTDIGERPEAINGNWGEWSSWSDCTRTCGAGVSTVERHCDNPMPSNGGKYCIGERKRYRICNTEPCEENTPSFRSIQCEEFNYIPYRNGLYEWETVSIPRNPCQLHCKPKNKFFSVMLKDTVTDGTPCTPGTRNMCISGRCRHVGCDWVIDSSAREDKCGICHGDGSSCETIKDQYNETQGLGYVEATVIPENARNIRVEEIAEANNYLALKNDKGDYYLNGHWFIQWSGDYEIAGTVVHYKREGNKEMFEAVGPLKEPLHIMLLLQSHNPGVSFEYTVPKINASVGRTQRSAVVCAERDGIVEDMYCNATTKPDDKMRVCNVHLCPARWWSGPWQHCSVTCGEGGVHRRTVICVRSLSEEQIALEDKACDGQDKPLEVETCHHKNACPGTSTWVVGDWVETMNLFENPILGNKTGLAFQLSKPKLKFMKLYCFLPVPAIKTKAQFQLSKPKLKFMKLYSFLPVQAIKTKAQCTRTCGGGIKYRKVSCTGSQLCDLETEPPSQSPCNNGDCPTTMHVTTTSLQVSHTSDQSDEATPVHNVTHSIENKENLAIENNNTETTKLKIDTSANSNNYALQPDILNESSKQDFINVKIHDTHVNQSNSKDLEQGVNIVLGSEDSFLNIQEGGLNLPERRINIHHNKKPEEDKNVRPDENDVQIGIEQMKHKHSKTEKKIEFNAIA
ncbi:hypothetical protein KUTeg_022609 [Tegillarca granosa]|uniref:Peptidase M12B domain-containing protein n=1 Tax=Tegillarca granosa TaxID=220873 RepID=A0ABQ9E8H2_TEGGR|nr:hypothetical protein KUTeg_022609 [Tegillarca granosa]